MGWGIGTTTNVKALWSSGGVLVVVHRKLFHGKTTDVIVRYPIVTYLLVPYTSMYWVTVWESRIFIVFPITTFVVCHGAGRYYL